MAQVRWSLTATSDLAAIEEFIAQDSVLHAVHFIDRLVHSVEKLATLPHAGRVVPEFRDENLREIIFRNYRVVYLVHDETVHIVRVVHGARDIGGLLSHPWELE